MLIDRSLFEPRRLAILVSPTDIISPSSLSTLDHFTAVAARHDVETELIGCNDLSRLPEFNGLFIRQTTSVGGIAHQFSQRARELGMPVLDDPLSIVRGSDKIIQHLRMAAQGVSMPNTRIVGFPGDIGEAAHALGLPLVLKIRNGCFCRGVERVDTISDGVRVATRLLAFSSQIVAQEYLQTSHDWRICVLAGSPLFACKYHMVRGHWQVVERGSRGSLVHGVVEAVVLSQAPASVIELALRAASCIGGGLYGVDIKDTADGPVVIEINDNPDMDFNEETVANPEAWDRLARWFVVAMNVADEPRLATA